MEIHTTVNNNVMLAVHLAVLLVASPLLAVGQEIPYSLLDFEVVPADDDNLNATWRAPEGAPEFSYFHVHFTNIETSNYHSTRTIRPDNSDFNRTGNMFSYVFSQLWLLRNYNYNYGYSYNNYAASEKSFLISLAGYDGTTGQYWFSDDAKYTPAKSHAPFELIVHWMSTERQQRFVRDFAEKLSLVLRSASRHFWRSRGTIGTYQVADFEGYSVYRAVISSHGENASLYRDILWKWLNEDRVLDPVIGREGKLVHYHDSYNGYEGEQVLITEGSCGFVISSVDDPYCPVNASLNTNLSTPATTATMALNATIATNATSSPTPANIDQTVAPASNGTSAIPIIALATSCIAIVLSLLVIVSLALYIVILKRKYEEERERKPGPFSENLMSFGKSPTGVAVVESPLYGHDGEFLIDNEEEQKEEEGDPQYDSESDTKGDSVLY